MSQTNPASPPVQTPGQASNPPPDESPTAVVEVNDDANYNIPTPPPICKRWQGMLWKIEVIQNPLRARMCGFGDKLQDRRPISPPPAVLLTIWDPNTGAEIDYKKISDLSKLILIVDLWNLHGTREDNCVRHTTTSPSISTTTAHPFPYTYTGKVISNPSVDYDGSRIPSYMNSYADQVIPIAANSGGPVQPANSSQPNYANDNHAHEARTNSLPNNHQSPSNAQFPGGYDHHSPSALVSPHSMTSSSRSSQDAGIIVNGGHRDSRELRDIRDHRETTIARNLIGNTTASANLLYDENGKHGIWFVLQDLSVRTEGWFRLKVNLFNLAQPPFMEEESSNTNNGNTNGSNNKDEQTPANNELLKEAPLLASAFSKPFKVFSAKKFPGVIESTNLSRTFAKQGIKIPIRKDHGGKKRKAGPDSDEEEYDE
ncbi:hypothetical protein H2204_009505 [Knufia peltigerae]|uniref:Velvet domain-containing protein n=1 Tax=Knufia peltigerae TaxID=1002370 RepID=A0AA39CUX1_9EURO|nr:hypothetical protein H2204_009505 [Knufia peltigerae]